MRLALSLKGSQKRAAVGKEKEENRGSSCNGFWGEILCLGSGGGRRVDRKGVGGFVFAIVIPLQWEVKKGGCVAR